MTNTSDTNCNLSASIGDDGGLVIEVDSEQCRSMVIDAVSEKGVSVKYNKPQAPEPRTDLG